MSSPKREVSIGLKKLRQGLHVAGAILAGALDLIDFLVFAAIAVAILVALLTTAWDDPALRRVLVGIALGGPVLIALRRRPS